MNGRCQHGLPADECLICKTLDPTSTATQTRPGRRTRGLSSGTLTDRPPVEVVSRRPARSLSSRLALWGMALVGVALAVWFVVGLVAVVFHVIALVAVAVAAGWLGYKVGHWQGRRHPDG
ncbi:MAG: hypothetical protein J2P57_18325 [Acidimicrobiaceae bacterium]|nr:hypothetical protein [Acidimicrobiaceae bacterium]